VKKEQLEKLKRLISETSGGPWRTDTNALRCSVTCDKGYIDLARVVGSRRFANAEFIAGSRLAIPDLIDMVEKLTLAINICDMTYNVVGFRSSAFAEVRRTLEEVYK